MREEFPKLGENAWIPEVLVEAGTGATQNWVEANVKPMSGPTMYLWLIALFLAHDQIGCPSWVFEELLCSTGSIYLLRVRTLLYFSDTKRILTDCDF